MITTIVAFLVLIKELLENKRLRKILRMIYEAIMEWFKDDDYEAVDLFLEKYMEIIGKDEKIVSNNIILLCSSYKDDLKNYDKFVEFYRE